ncbi:MAG: hypothetical protein HUU01_22510 [Saprospiraceae bacterium]|nr:hypothetical protein [Saprospiraceae bacterium]
MKKVILSLIVLHTLAFQCDPGTGIYDTNARDMEIITGFQVRAANGIELQKFGNPNSKTGGIATSPNPANASISGTGPDIVRKVWFVPGLLEYDFQGVEFDILYQNHLYPETEIEENRVRFYTPNSAYFFINVSEVPSGYYRVFYQLDNGELLWDNLYIDHERPFQESVDQLAGVWD